MTQTPTDNIAAHIERIKAAPPVPGALVAADYYVLCMAAATRTHDVWASAQAAVAHMIAQKAQAEAQRGTSAYHMAQTLHGHPDGAPELATLTAALTALQQNVVAQLEKMAGITPTKPTQPSESK